MNYDPYDTGTPKYKGPYAIYDGLRDMVQTEEINILSEMFPDVSYDNQDYYYTDKGSDLLESFEELSGHGDKMWVMELAVWQIDRDEIHDIVYEALRNPDLAKRLDFKKLFIEYMLHGYERHYNEIVEEFLLELQELDRFGNIDMIQAFNRVMRARGDDFYITPYVPFSHALCVKAGNLRLYKETKLIAECRALLSSYDDFIMGLRMNQALYEAQERQYKMRAAELKASYDEKVRLLYLLAEQKGILLGTDDSLPLLLPEEG